MDGRGRCRNRGRRGTAGLRTTKGDIVRRYFLPAVVVAVLAAAPTATALPSPPSSIASIGDSITRATDVCCWYGDHPRHSWSTGGAPFDGIRSHYERIRA